MKIVLFITTLLIVAPSFAAPNNVFNPGFSSFKVTVQGVDNYYEVLALSAMPKETLHIKSSTDTSISVVAGSLKKKTNNRWEWTAPTKSGLYPVVITPSTGKGMTLNVFVLRPASDIKKGKLDGYHIGPYPSKPFKNLATYHAPRGYLEVTRANKHTLVSPHFTLEQFLCKLPAVNGKKFIVLTTTLILKLERILQAVNNDGFSAESLYIMSGYRTPFYNRSIGSKRHSRHIYGDAVDIYIDVSPEDGVIDDLNKDGKINRKDAAVLYDLIERLSQHESWGMGGLGEYKATSTHGPFVHVDSRGYRARWGKPSATY